MTPPLPLLILASSFFRPSPREQALLLSRITEWREDDSFSVVMKVLSCDGAAALTALLKSKEHKSTHKDIAYTLANLL